MISNDVGLWAMLAAVGVGMLAVPWMMSRYSINRPPGGPVRTCAELTMRPLPEGGERCVVGGAAVPGPDGTFTAPVSGRACVWALRRVSERRRGRYGDVDRLRAEEASTAPFLLEDGPARVRVDPAGTQPDFLFHSITGVVSHAEGHLPAADLLPHADRYERAPGGLHLFSPLGRTTEEWIVPPGEHVWLDGVATQGPDGTVVLSRPPGGTMYLSVRPPEARARSGARTLTMGRRMRWIGVAVLALAAACLVAGLVWTGGVL